MHTYNENTLKEYWANAPFVGNGSTPIPPPLDRILIQTLPVTQRNQELREVRTLDMPAVHCTENSKHIFPEMKLSGLVPNFYIHVSGSNLYIPNISLILNLYFPLLRERDSGSTNRRAGNCRVAVVGISSSAFSPPHLLLKPRAHITICNLEN
jgi:hypothetical protein